MNIQDLPGTFENLSQRVVLSYCKLLADFPQSEFEEDGFLTAIGEASCRDLHQFFQAFFQSLYDYPEQFGLPVSDDVFIDTSLTKSQADKQEVNRKLQRPRDLINTGLDFLQAAGMRGTLQDTALIFDQNAVMTALKKPKTLKKFIQGLTNAGLRLEENDGQAVLTNTLYPAMMPALKALAQGCDQVADEREGKFYFARCDFQVLKPGYRIQATDLYCIFNPADVAHLEQLHHFFLQKNYKPIVSIAGPFAWNVQYQGNKKIKSTPLFQVEYQERRKNPLMTAIKCASSNRVVPLLGGQSQALRADFLRRTNHCNGDACGWCKNRKALGPSIYEHDGTSTTICWYTNPDIQNFDAQAVDLVQQYTLLHEALA